MDFKKFWKETFAGFILKNILLAVIIFVGLAWGTLLFIDFYTHHGESQVVPDLRGSYIEEAEVLLANKGLTVQIVDSVYISGKKLGTIVEQTPSPNSLVKSNRPIYVIINSRQVKMIPLPEVNDVSYRQADAILNAIGLSVSNVEYQPSEYKDLVIEVKYHGRSITAGTRLPEKSAVVLVVGSGLSDDLVSVPSLKGMNIETGRDSVVRAMLVVGATNYDVNPSGDENKYVIYRQKPAAGKSVPAGTRIDLWLSKDKSLLDKVFEEDTEGENTDSEEEFF
jgi:eukaryotic-like serine/threonine-protein kinase